jgi:hypothetical protein
MRTVLNKRARTSLVLGVVSLVFCGVFFGPAAIVEGYKAKGEIASSDVETGDGLATAGMVLGVVGFIGFFVFAFVRFNASS